jgi:hypothetical protein
MSWYGDAATKFNASDAKSQIKADVGEEENSSPRAYMTGSMTGKRYI